MVKKIKIIGIINLALILTILVSIFTYSYYINSNQLFLDANTPDGANGFGMKRNANEFNNDGCGAGTILDTVTGVCWLKNMNLYAGTHNWTNSNSYCLNLNYAGHTNWELPTRPELFSLLNINGALGSTCTTLISFGFTNCKLGEYYASDLWYGRAESVNFQTTRSTNWPFSIWEYQTCVVRS